MNHRHLRSFLVLADELHFGNAAERLYIAQPPLSRMIKELEQDLGVTLFTRTKRKVSLTKSGEFLKAEAQKLFLQMDFIKNQVGSIQNGKSGTIRIGYVGAAMHSLLPRLLVNLRKHLDIRMVLLELKNEEQVTALNLGQIDVGFVRSVPENRSILATEIYRESFALVLPLDHPLASKKNIQLKELANDPFIGLTYDCAPRLCDTITGLCNRAGFSPKIAHETSQVNSILRLVECGLGYSIVPASVQNAYSLRLRFVELKHFKEKAQLFLMHKKEMPDLVSNCVKILTGAARSSNGKD